MEALHPIAYLERERLVRQLDRRHAGRWLTLAAYTFVMLVAAIPFVIYITEQSVFLLVFMVAIIVPAQIMVIVRTLTLAVERIVSERTTGTWDAIVMTGITASQVVDGKRWAITRTMLPEWMFMAVARFGLGYGLAQYLHNMSRFYCTQQFPDAFCYFGPAQLLINPSIIKVGAAVAFLLTITFLELRLTIVIALVASLLPTNNRTLILTIAALFWLTVVAFGILSTTLLSPLKQWTQFEQSCSVETLCYRYYVWIEDGRLPNSTERAIGRSGYTSFMSDLWRTADITQVGTTTFIDGGTLLAANTMRPYYWRPINLLVRNIISVVVALLGFKTLTWIFLYLARKLAIRQGALPDKRRYWLRKV